MFSRKLHLFFTLLATLLFTFIISYSSTDWASGTAEAGFVRQAPILASNAHAMFTTKQGLAGNYVTAVAIAKDDSAWIGTTEGVTRIQGRRWTTFTRVHGLADDWITAVAISSDQRVWLGTASGGLSVFDPTLKRFSTFSINNSGIPSNFITAVIVDPHNHVWVATLNNGAAQYDPAVDKWTGYHFPDDSLTALAVDSEGLPWAGTNTKGAYHWDGNKWLNANLPGSGRVKQIQTATGGQVTAATTDGRFRFDGKAWIKTGPDPVVNQVANDLGLDPDAIVTIVGDQTGLSWVGTSNGLYLLAAKDSDIPRPVQPLPLVLVHGWTVAASDELDDGEFRFLKDYAERDGIPLFYAKGISPLNTLYENAAKLNDDIQSVKKATGAAHVNILAFSMGGLNTRALLESSLYQKDVNRAIILGTPEAGVDIWKPVLAQQIIAKPEEPSAIELSPEYARLFNQTHSPRAGIPYDLLIGDARQQPLVEFIQDMPANDGLIGVASALALDGANVRKSVDGDLHAFNPTPIPLKLTSYLYPRDTYERYLRNAFRDPTNAPIGSEVVPASQPSPSTAPGANGSNHTPVETVSLGAGESVTRTVVLDENNTARFISYFPGGNVEFSLTAPDGTQFSPINVIGRTDVITLETELASFGGYEIKHAQPGRWLLTLKRTDQGKTAVDVTTYVDLDAPRRLMATLSSDNVQVGQPVVISANLGPDAPQAKVSAHIAIPSSPPGGAWTPADLQLDDKGNGNFAGSFTPSRPGYYVIIVNAVGTGLVRGTELLVAASPGGARIGNTGEPVVERDASGKINRVTVGVDLSADRGGKYALGSTLSDRSGNVAASITFPFLLSPGVNHESISFDTSDLAVPGPYNLDLTLMDTSWAAIRIDGAQNVRVIQP